MNKLLTILFIALFLFGGYLALKPHPTAQPVPLIQTPHPVNIPRHTPPITPQIHVTTTPLPVQMVSQGTIDPTYSISTALLPNGTINDVIVELTFQTNHTVGLTCPGTKQYSMLPERTSSTWAIYWFTNTTCVKNQIAEVEYKLPNGKMKKTRMPMSYDTKTFELNISGE